MRTVLLAASLILCCEAWSQAPEPADREAGIAKFRSRLASDIRRFQGRYPPAAAEKGQQGKVVIAVAVDAGGRSTCTLKSSSGHDILDQRALAIVRYAASNVPLPEALRGVAFSTDVALRFALPSPSKPRLQVT